MKMLTFALLFAATLPTQTFAHEKPSCLSFAGQQKCGYGCVQSFGQIYCGDKPGMSCLTAGGTTKCGFDCKQFAGQIKCGSGRGDNCVVAVGQIECGHACRVETGQIKCGIDKDVNGRGTN